MFPLGRRMKKKRAATDRSPKRCSAGRHTRIVTRGFRRCRPRRLGETKKDLKDRRSGACTWAANVHDYCICGRCGRENPGFSLLAHSLTLPACTLVQGSPHMFEATLAGSLPKPAWLAETHKLWPQWRLEGAELKRA